MVDESSSCTLFALGSNGSGQLGVGHREDLSEPATVTRTFGGHKQEVVNVASGGNHSVFLCKNGAVWTAGANPDGRCLRSTISDDSSDLTIPSQASDPVVVSLNVVQIAATWEATFLVAQDGMIYCAGAGPFGELGLGAGNTTAMSVSAIRDFPPPGTHIVKLAACMAHVVVVLSNGDVWGWGAGRKGQLGAPAENVWLPRRFDGVPFTAQDIICGKDFTCIFGSPASGDFSIFGVARNDRFGVRANAPLHVGHWKRIAATWGSILVQKDDGSIVSWGRNDHGQLPPPALPPLTDFATGSEHCVGVTEDGSLIAWGWGEHGNCGTTLDASGDVKGRWNLIARPGAVLRVFAGCATTFYSISPEHDPSDGIDQSNIP
jgi:protein ATS1